MSNTPHATQPSRRFADYRALYEYLGRRVPMATLRQLVHTGQLPHVRLSPRKPLFDLDAVDEFLRQRSAGGAR